MAAILGIDVSHWQGAPNWAAVKASGREFVVIKATESTNFVDGQLAASRRNARAAGLIVGLYHFARAGNAAAEAAFFVRTIGALQPGEFLVLDQEVPNSVGWCQQWLDAVYAATGVRPLIYMNQSAATGLKLGNWGGVAQNYGLWLAKYDQAPNTIDSVPYWGAPAMKQFYDKGTVPGVSGPCDVDVFYGSREQLLAYGKGGAAPSPIAEDDMFLGRTPDGGVYVCSEFSVHHVPDPPTYAAYQALGVPEKQISPDQLTLLVNHIGQRRADLLNDVHRWVLCRTPDDRSGKPWPVDAIYGTNDNVGEVKTDIGKVQAPDPSAVADAIHSWLDANKDTVIPGLGASIAAKLQLTSRD